MSNAFRSGKVTLSLGAAALLLLSGCQQESGALTIGDAPICRVAHEPSVLPSKLPEASGVAVSRHHPGMVWAHNDSGTRAELLALTVTGELIGSVTPGGGGMRDWEDMALASCADGDCLYVADIGDNAAERSEITVYRLPEPDPGSPEIGNLTPFRMRYPSGPRDAEALFVLPGEQLFIVTKGGEERIELYRYPGTLAEAAAGGPPVELELVKALSNGVPQLSDRVTGAASNADGDWIAIRTYTTLLLYPTEELLRPNTTATPYTIDLRMLAEPQGEGVALGPEGSVVLISEGGAKELPGTISVLWCDVLTKASGGPSTPAD